MQAIGMFFGAFIAVFLVSRTILVIFRRWVSGIRLLLIGNGLSLLVVTTIAGFGMADGRGFVPIEAVSIYGPAQLLTFLLDISRHARKSNSGNPAIPDKDD